MRFNLNLNRLVFGLIKFNNMLNKLSKILFFIFFTRKIFTSTLYDFKYVKKGGKTHC